MNIVLNFNFLNLLKFIKLSISLHLWASIAMLLMLSLATSCENSSEQPNTPTGLCLSETIEVGTKKKTPGRVS